MNIQNIFTATKVIFIPYLKVFLSKIKAAAPNLNFDDLVCADITQERAKTFLTIFWIRVGVQTETCSTSALSPLSSLRSLGARLILDEYVMASHIKKSSDCQCSRQQDEWKRRLIVSGLVARIECGVINSALYRD